MMDVRQIDYHTHALDVHISGKGYAPDTLRGSARKAITNGARRFRAFTDHAHDFGRTNILWDKYIESIEHAQERLVADRRILIGIEMNATGRRDGPIDVGDIGGMRFCDIYRSGALDLLIVSLHDYYYRPNKPPKKQRKRGRRRKRSRAKKTPLEAYHPPYSTTQDYINKMVRTLDAVEQIRSLDSDIEIPIILGHPLKTFFELVESRGSSDFPFPTPYQLDQVVDALVRNRVYPELNTGAIYNGKSDINREEESLFGRYVKVCLENEQIPYVSIGSDNHTTGGPVVYDFGRHGFLKDAVVWLPPAKKKKNNNQK